MEIKKNIENKSYAVKFTVEENGKIIGRAYLYIIYNDLHEEPYGLLEDVFIEEEFRGSGLGTKLVNSVIEEAKKIGCSKLIGQSRHERTKVHAWYEKFGFKNHGLNFRMDFINYK